MRVLIVKNRHKKKLSWSRGIQYFHDKTPLKLEIDEIKTDFDFTFKNISNATFKNSYQVGGDYLEKLRTVVLPGKYDVVCLVYGNKPPGPRSGYAEKEPLYEGTYVIQVIKDDDGGKQFNHEIFHLLFRKLKDLGIVLEDPMDMVTVDGVKKPYFNNDNLNAKVSNRTIALDRLKPHWNALQGVKKPSMIETLMNAITPKIPYLYFKENEIVGLKPELVAMLDKARDIAEVPFVITSGYRTEEHNKEVGGVDGSSHTSGLAVDLLVKDSVLGGKILLALAQAGFKRFGFYKDGHIHVDIDPSKPSPCYWIK